MKNLVKGNILKKFISIILILAIVIPYLPMSVFANDGDETEENEYAGIVDLDVAWKTGDEVLNGYATNNYNLQYTLKLNQISSGFEDVKVNIETDNVAGVNDYVYCRIQEMSGNGFATINYGKRDTGSSLQENVSIGFRNKNEVLNRTVTVKATGRYKDANNPNAINGYVTFSVKKVLKANITPYDKRVTPYNVTLQWSQDGLGRPKSTYNRQDLGLSIYGKSKGWYMTKLNTSYPLYIYSGSLTQKLDLKVTINRYIVENNENVSKLSDGYTVDWDGLDEILGEPTQTTNEDGTITYTFSKGEETQGLDRSKTFSVDKEFNIKIVYQTPNTNPEDENSVTNHTYWTYQADLNTKGYKIEQNWGEEETVEEVTKSLKLYDRGSTGVCLYTPGYVAWIHANYGSGDYLPDNFVSDLKTDRTTTVDANVDLTYISGEIRWASGDYLEFKKPTLRYMTDDGNLRTINLSSNQLKIDKVSVKHDIGSTFVYENENSEFSGEYNVVSDTNSFRIYLPDSVTNIAKYARDVNDTETFSDLFTLTYTLNADALGLTDTELENILALSFEEELRGPSTNGGSKSTLTLKNQSFLNEIKYSYMEMELIGDFDTSETKIGKSESKSIKLKMYRNQRTFGNDTDEKKKIVLNENPTFFVSLPSGFEYSNIEVKSLNNKITIDEDNLDIISVDGEQVLVIPCYGTYDSKELEEADVYITYTRTLRDTSNRTFNIDAYMITDNENYVRKTSNLNNFHKDGEEAPDSVFYTYETFNLVGGSELNVKTRLIADREYDPNNEESAGQKNNPAIVDFSKNNITILSQVDAVGDTLTNVEILTRLPFANNTYIYNTENQLIEANYNEAGELNSFIDNHSGKLKGIAKNTVIPQVTFSNIAINGVYKISGKKKTKINESEYQIYYTTEDNAEFDSTTFIEYEDGVSDLSQAKNIKVVLKNESGKQIEVKSGEAIYVEYNVTMPDNSGMMATTSSIKYTRKSNSQEETLHSSPVYAINGDTTGTIKVQKKFENHRIGVAAYGVSLEGIEFKLQYYDEATGEKKFLQNENNEDIVATTNSSGIATFANIPAGTYYLYEVTEFERYSGIGGLNIINVNPAETVNYTAINYLKHGDIIIHKKWQGTNDNQGRVSFLVKRVNATNETYETVQRTVQTDENGDAVVRNVPYGAYQISEISGKDGWVSASENVMLVLDAEEKSIDGYDNIPGKGILQIVKTVPPRESVEELSFHIVGRGMISFNNTNGEEVDTNCEYTIKVSDEQQPENVEVTVSEDKTTATIKISDLYLGYYTIEEVNIPVLEGTDIQKYSPVSREVYLTKHDTENPVVLNIENNYKYGNIEINKTAKLKEGDQYTDIGDLSEFKVRVTGTSYYGNTIDATIQLDEDGHGVGKFEIGEYTITEEPADGYTAYYGINNTASTDPVNVRVQTGRTITQNLYNEHTGIGYVRVEKSLEGVEDPQTVINAGIQFAIVGQNVAGGRVNETITINQIDETKNVAYGISGPISSGGEYELQEIESTVPEFYEAVETQEISIRTEHTASTPLVKDITNPRSRGNLEIITTTNPEGGPLTGITYKVTEVKLGENGTYTKIGTPVDVDGSNDSVKPSFAELSSIYAGYYLVEQVTVPDGWIKDVSQIVEVPADNIGYANFEITAKKKLQKNKVTINKVILNEVGLEATAEEISAAQLNANESFEVKIANIQTQEEYYVFTSPAKPGVIQGLDAGTYKVEEVFKPKYTTAGYYIQRIVDLEAGDIREEKIEATEGTYQFTITEQENKAEDVTLTIKNQINTKYGFGGQESIDNLSKEQVNEEEVTYVTKSIIYVTDENGNAISGVKFNLFDSENRKVYVGDKDEFEIANKKLIIKGLPVGIYTLKCTGVPEGYLVPNDEKIVVYSDATQVARVEIQKNIPRGGLTLSTTYKNEKGETKYLPRSKYKVVDSEGNLVKFVKTSTGDYKKSNLEDASPIVVLKSGVVELEGLETGNYEVGIVNVTDGYGIQKELPEYVEVVENTDKEVNVEVIKNEVVSIDVDSYWGYGMSMYLDNNGDLYALGGDTNGGKEAHRQWEKVTFPVDNVKIVKFSYGYHVWLAVDTEGRVWGHSANNNDPTEQIGDISEATQYGMASGGFTVCITEDGTLKDAYYNKNARFIDVQTSYGQTILLDDQGRVWTIGRYTGNGDSSRHTDANEIASFAENDIKIEKLAKIANDEYYPYMKGVIDTEGKVWIWGYNGNSYYQYVPICISDTTNLNNVDVKDVLVEKNAVKIIDTDGYIWNLNYGETVATRWDKSIFDGAKIEMIRSGYDVSAAIDEYGRVWTWGTGTYGELGIGSLENVDTPTCISKNASDVLYDVKIKDIAISEWSYGHVLALDTNNRLWAWGGKSTTGEIGTASSEYISTPRRLQRVYDAHLEYNLKFKKVFADTQSGPYAYFAIDTEGKVWVWGNNYGGTLGLTYVGNSNFDTDITMPTVLEEVSSVEMKKISTYYHTTIMLSEDGRVYICGYDGLKGDGTSISNYRGICITEITDNFNLPQNTCIVDVNAGDGYYMALDSEGNVYTWGISSSKLLGRNAGSSYKTIGKVTDLSGINIKKIEIGYSTASAISEDGKLYSLWSSSTELYETNNTFVDIKGNHLLDNEGHVWYLDNYDNTLREVTTSTSHILNKKYQENENYKIIKMYEITQWVAILQDSNGDYWFQSADSMEPTKWDTGINNVASIANKIFVDSSGSLWAYNGQDGSGVSSFAVGGKNQLFGKKAAHIDTISVSSRVDYLLNKNGTSIDSSNIVNAKYYLENEMKINVVDFVENRYGEIELLLDVNGKIWKSNICLSETNTTLKQLYDNDSNYKIKRIMMCDSNCYAVDSNGKVWVISGTNNVSCLNDTSGVDIADITEISNGNGERYTLIAKDDSGNVWVWGDTYGGLGEGTGLSNNYGRITNPYHINTKKLDGKAIKDIVVDKNHGILVCEDGSVYISGANSSITSSKEWSYVGVCEGATRVYTTKNNYSRSYASNMDNKYQYIVTGDNKVWTFGYNLTRTPSVISSEIADTAINFSDHGTDNYTNENAAIDLVDANGQLWIFTENNTLEKDESVGKIVYINGGTVVDIDGKTKNRYVATSGNIVVNYGDISQDVINIYGEVNEENIKKYYAIETKGQYKFVDGKVYKGTSTLVDFTGTDLEDKTIVECGCTYALDSEGYIYELATGKCLTTYIAEDAISSNNEVINVSKENKLYGTKFKDVANDRFAIAENGDLWYFGVSGEPVNITQSEKGRKNPLAGKEIVHLEVNYGNHYAVTSDHEVWNISGDVPKYVFNEPDMELKFIYRYYSTDSYQFYVALDYEGNIWVCGQHPDNLGLPTGAATTDNEIICLNDIQGTPLYSNKQSDPEFKIEKISNVSTGSPYGFVAIDNYGKLWAWGSNYSGYLGAGNTSKVTMATCITQTGGDDIFYAFYRDGIKMEEILQNGYELKDSKGNSWYIDSSTKKWVPFPGSKAGDIASAGDDFAITEILNSRSVILGNNGKVYGNKNNTDVFKEAEGIGEFIKLEYETASSTTVSTSPRIIIRTNFYIGYKADGTYSLTENIKTEDGTVTDYSWTSEKIGEFTEVGYKTYTSTTISTSPRIIKRTNIYIGYKDDGVYRLSENITTENGIKTDYNWETEQIYSKKIVKNYFDTLLIDEDGALLEYVYSSKSFVSRYEDSESALYNQKVTDLENINGTMIITGENGKLYGYQGVHGTTMGEFTFYDDFIQDVYGEVNNDLRIQVAREFIRFNYPQSNFATKYLSTNGDIYDVSLYNGVLTWSKTKLSGDYFGVGKVSRVVGEYEFEDSYGDIYRVIPTGVSSYTVEKTTNITPFQTAEPTEEIQIDGVEIVKQTQHKALDSNGNLYVWDEYTGLSQDREGVINLTDTQYSIEPIYSHGNGWSVIKRSY
ncbi:MAG: hypothetical protein IJ890_02725 [Clostridia bacterium]|nr:hypothetical protein [Clostridia bacterium]